MGVTYNWGYLQWGFIIMFMPHGMLLPLYYMCVYGGVYVFMGGVCVCRDVCVCVIFY